MNGREEVKEFFARLINEAEYEKFEPVDFVTDGNKVVVKGDARVLIKDTKSDI